MTTEEKNYITRAGFDELECELRQLVEVDRPQVVDIVSWAASNGDRSENGDYIYGKKRLREIDRRLRFLTKRLDVALIVDPSLHVGGDQIFFGATVKFIRDDGTKVHPESSVTIVGVDEIDSGGQKISWHSPMARALLKARLHDEVILRTPDGGQEILTITQIDYPIVR